MLIDKLFSEFKKANWKKYLNPIQRIKKLITRFTSINLDQYGKVKDIHQAIDQLITELSKISEEIKPPPYNQFFDEYRRITYGDFSKNKTDGVSVEESDDNSENQIVLEMPDDHHDSGLEDSDSEPQYDPTVPLLST